jgi:hypothetical protein
MKTMNQGIAAISGSWTHLFEEDDGAVLVYRPTQTYAFPPSRRGREIFEFADDGDLIEQTPGPDDRPVVAGRWRALGMSRYGIGGTPDAPERMFEIVESGPQILKIRKI